MKKILLNLFFGVCWCVTALGDPTPTNSVKGSALSLATTPLSGAELVYLIQSGATKMATDAQIIAAATAQDIATSNALAANIAVLSNSIPGTITAYNYVTTGTLTTYQALMLPSTPANIASSNFLSNAQVASSNFTSRAQIASSNFLSNAQVASSNFQSGAQVNTSINSALAGIGAVTNAGSAIFGSVQVTNLIVPTLILPVVPTGSVVGGGQISTNLDCSKANYFSVNIAPLSGGTIVYGLTNFVDGQTISLILKSMAGSSAWRISSAPTMPGVTVHGSQLNGALVNSGDTWFLNWVVMGSDIVFSGGKL